MLEVIYGDEPYMIHSYIKEWKSKIEMSELQLRESEGFGNGEVDFLESVSFFDTEQKHLYVYLPMLAGEDADRLLEWVEHNPSADILVCIGAVDKRTKTWKKANQLFQVRFFPKLTEEAFDKNVEVFLNKRGKAISDDGLYLFCDKMCYTQNEDVNLFDVSHELEKLVLYVGDRQVIGKTDIEACVIPNDHENVFAILGFLEKGLLNEAVSQCELLIKNKTSSAIAILYLLERNYRLSWKSSVFKGENLGNRGPAPRKMNASKALGAMLVIRQGVSSLKSGEQDEMICLIITLSKLAGLYKEDPDE